MKEVKTIFKPLAGIEPHIFGLLVILNGMAQNTIIKRMKCLSVRQPYRDLIKLCAG